MSIDSYLSYLWARMRQVSGGVVAVFVPPSMSIQVHRAQIGYTYLMAQPLLKPYHVCGILAQPKGESGFDPCAQGDYIKGESMALGMLQWWPPRRRAIKAGCGIDIDALVAAKDFSDEAVLKQFQAMWWELQNTEHHALLQILTTTNAYDAGFIAEKTWVRSDTSGDPEKRGGFAADFSTMFSVPS